ncbi:DNA cytosine methyltransferase [Paenibacillus sp. S-12]|uniref:DNA cytosine methyltransferase n=1 Tax=Paenibacillus sp. S-12 TaxID=3031371 RepID=UPI0025A1E057|nr:DNA cytosine methyltransferase [Paenibacillus sp. S-12]
MPYAIDLFCGAGGMSEGILQAGFEILFSNDINEDVERTYVNRHEQLGLIQNYNTYFHRGDISQLNGDFIWNCIKNLKIFSTKEKPIPTGIDAIFGGPPCQGFSRAGRRKTDDPRNLLFREYLRIINEIKPKYVVMENVEGFNDTKFYDFKGVTGEIYPDASLAPDILINEFQLIGYDVLPPKVLDASDYGVPQKRKRAIFIAYLRNEHIPQYPFPTHSNEKKITVLDAVGDLIRDHVLLKSINSELTNYQLESRRGRTPNVSGTTISSNGQFHNNDISNHQPIIIERFSLFQEGEDGNSLRNRIMREGINLSNKPCLLQECETKLSIDQQEIIQFFKGGNVTNEMLDALLTKKSIRTRLNRALPSLTVVTLPDDYISPFEDRIFSVRELARLQSFDDSFVFLGKRTTGGSRRKLEAPQYTQVGNAVPPLLSKAIATEIMNAIRGTD